MCATSSATPENYIRPQVMFVQLSDKRLSGYGRATADKALWGKGLRVFGGSKYRQIRHSFRAQFDKYSTHIISPDMHMMPPLLPFKDNFLVTFCVPRSYLFFSFLNFTRYEPPTTLLWIFLRGYETWW